MAVPMTDEVRCIVGDDLEAVEACYCDPDVTLPGERERRIGHGWALVIFEGVVVHATRTSPPH